MAKPLPVFHHVFLAVWTLLLFGYLAMQSMDDIAILGTVLIGIMTVIFVIIGYAIFVFRPYWFSKLLQGFGSQKEKQKNIHHIQVLQSGDRSTSKKTLSLKQRTSIHVRRRKQAIQVIDDRELSVANPNSRPQSSRNGHIPKIKPEIRVRKISPQSPPISGSSIKTEPKSSPVSVLAAIQGDNSSTSRKIKEPSPAIPTLVKNKDAATKPTAGGSKKTLEKLNIKKIEVDKETETTDDSLMRNVHAPECIRPATNVKDDVSVSNIRKILWEEERGSGFFKFLLNKDGGMLKLPFVRVRFTPNCVKEEKKLRLMPVYRQDNKREKGKTFVTPAIHLSEENSSCAVEFECPIELSIRPRYYPAENDKKVHLEVTENSKDLNWAKTETLNFTEDQEFIRIKLQRFSGIRVVCEDPCQLIPACKLFHVLFVKRPTGISDPVQHNFYVLIHSSDDKMCNKANAMLYNSQSVEVVGHKHMLPIRPPCTFRASLASDGMAASLASTEILEIKTRDEQVLKTFPISIKKEDEDLALHPHQHITLLYNAWSTHPDRPRELQFQWSVPGQWCSLASPTGSMGSLVFNASGDGAINCTFQNAQSPTTTVEMPYLMRNQSKPTFSTHPQTVTQSEPMFSTHPQTVTRGQSVPAKLITMQSCNQNSLCLIDSLSTSNPIPVSERSQEENVEICGHSETIPKDIRSSSALAEFSPNLPIGAVPKQIAPFGDLPFSFIQKPESSSFSHGSNSNKALTMKTNQNMGEATPKSFSCGGSHDPQYLGSNTSPKLFIAGGVGDSAYSENFADETIPKRLAMQTAYNQGDQARVYYVSVALRDASTEEKAHISVNETVPKYSSTDAHSEYASTEDLWGADSGLYGVLEREREDITKTTGQTVEISLSPVEIWTKPAVEGDLLEKIFSEGSGFQSEGDILMPESNLAISPSKTIEKEVSEEEGHTAKIGCSKAILEEVVLKKATKVAPMGPKGGKVELYESRLAFPTNAVTKNIYFKVSMDNNPAKYPKDRVPITPILGVEPKVNFNKPVSVWMRTWYSAAKGEKLNAQILTKEDGGDWEVEKEVVLSDTNEVKFDVWHFCEKCIAVSRENSTAGEYHFMNDVYIQRKSATIISAFFKDEKTQNETRQGFYNLQYIQATPRHQIIRGGANSIFELAIDCEKPKNATYHGMLDIPQFKISQGVKDNLVSIGFYLKNSKAEKYKGSSFIARHHVTLQGTKDCGDCPYNRHTLLSVPWPIELTTIFDKVRRELSSRKVKTEDHEQPAGSSDGINISVVTKQENPTHLQAMKMAGSMNVTEKDTTHTFANKQ